MDKPPEPPARSAAYANRDTRQKRSKTQRLADMPLVERWAIQGKTVRQIVELLSAQRDYVISKSQISADLVKLQKQWEAESKAMLNTAKAQMLQSMRRQEDELWEAWEKSKADVTRQTLTKRTGGTGEGKQEGGETKSAVKVTGNGDPSYMRLILEIQERRAKLLGIDAPTKSEVSGPGGGPIPTANVSLSDAEQEAILARHFARRQAASPAAPPP